MNDLKAYLEKRGITDEQMEEARRATQAYLEAFTAFGDEENYRFLSDLAANIEIEAMKLAFGQFLDDFSRAENKERLIESEP